MALIEIHGKKYDTDLVIFDKDGTLIDFNDTWISVIRELIRVIGTHTPMSDTLNRRIEKALGIFITDERIDGFGPLAMGTAAQCDTLLTYCLYQEGLRWDKSMDIVETVKEEIFSGKARKKYVKPAKGVIKTLERLQSRGIKIAIATNDNAADAMKDMETIGAAGMIDLCVGADSVERAKPAPDMINHIMETFSTGPDHTIFAGDTIMDALTGKNAGVMLTIGIEGILPMDTLNQYTDITIASLDEIDPLL